MYTVIYIMGVSGSGKTTIAKLLSKKTGLPFFDGDDFHPSDNKEKMKTGHRLTDEDRQQWLHTINALAGEQSKLKGAIIACSALKKKYRIVLSQDILKPTWVFLQGTYDLIHKRMEKREHFMPVQLLRSQFEDMEIPTAAFTVDIKNEPDKIVEMIVQYLDDRKQL